MKFNFNKKLAVLYSLGFLLLPGIVAADWTVQSVVDSAVSMVEVLFSVAAVIYFLWYGIMFLMARGNAEQVRKARTGVLYGVVGLVLASVALLIVDTVKGFFNL